MVDFLLDRDIGRYQVSAALQEHDLVVRTLFDVYGEREQFITDVEWLTRAGEEEWAVITADARIRRRALERAVVDRWQVKIFTLPHGNLTGPEQVARVIDNLEAILRAATRPGPAIYVLLPQRIERRHP
ncbi:hypothetical protein [Euzebya sp.]|uniref:PIN-like domain-containing protein n=1 Tax=Euzebya sp. TaxID=1971409 RepID=UPI0035185762